MASKYRLKVEDRVCVPIKGKLPGAEKGKHTNFDFTLDMERITQSEVTEHVKSGETIENTGRRPSASLALELTAAQEVTFMGTVEAATTQTVGIIHGTAAGKKSLLWVPKMQLINPRKQSVGGKRLIGFEGRLIPTTGNDEFRLSLF